MFTRVMNNSLPTSLIFSRLLDNTYASSLCLIMESTNIPAVWILSTFTVVSMAERRILACVIWPKCSNMSTDALSMAIGLAIFLPAIAVPVFLVPGSNMAYWKIMNGLNWISFALVIEPVRLLSEAY